MRGRASVSIEYCSELDLPTSGCRRYHNVTSRITENILLKQLLYIN